MKRGSIVISDETLQVLAQKQEQITSDAKKLKAGLFALFMQNAPVFPEESQCSECEQLNSELYGCNICKVYLCSVCWNNIHQFKSLRYHVRETRLASSGSASLASPVSSKKSSELYFDPRLPEDLSIYNFPPIGFIQTSFKDKFGIPRQPGDKFLKIRDIILLLKTQA